jgi:hypothetical protein
MLGLQLIIFLIALCWVALDSNATAAFEILKKQLHGTARDMGMYWKWLLQSLLRAALLTSLVLAGIVVATRMFQQNPWDLERLASRSLFAAMLTSSLALLAMPQLSAHLRLQRLLDSKAAGLTQLVAALSSEEGVRQHLEPAEHPFAGVDGWPAWHPKQEQWEGNRLWSDLVPVIYRRQETETSLIIPMDFEHFLAWKLPAEIATPGTWMPIWPRFSVKSARDLRGRKGWSVVKADLEDEDEPIHDA